MLASIAPKDMLEPLGCFCSSFQGHALQLALKGEAVSCFIAAVCHPGSKVLTICWYQGAIITYSHLQGSTRHPRTVTERGMAVDILKPPFTWSLLYMSECSVRKSFSRALLSVLVVSLSWKSLRTHYLHLAVRELLIQWCRRALERKQCIL